MKPDDLHFFAAEAMACRFELVVRHPDRLLAQSAAEAAFDELQVWHRRLNRFDRSSAISHLRSALVENAPGTPVQADGETVELLGLCRDAFVATSGAFDVAPVPRDPLAPGSAEFALLFDPGRGLVSLRPDGSRSAGPGRPTLTIDLGGIAKGWAIDRAIAVLRQAGIADAFLHGGTSSAAAIGFQAALPSQAKVPWTIGLPPYAELAAPTSTADGTLNTPPPPFLPAPPPSPPTPSSTLHLIDRTFSMSAHRGGANCRPGGHIRGLDGEVIRPHAASRRAAWAISASAAWAEVITTALCAGWALPVRSGLASDAFGSGLSNGSASSSGAETADLCAESRSDGHRTVDLAAVMGDSGRWERVIPPSMPECFAQLLT